MTCCVRISGYFCPTVAASSSVGCVENDKARWHVTEDLFNCRKFRLALRERLLGRFAILSYFDNRKGYCPISYMWSAEPSWRDTLKSPAVAARDSCPEENKPRFFC